MGFVIQSMIFPAAPEDADPFVGERAQGGLEAMAGGFALLKVGPGPGGVFDGFLGPFHKRLTSMFVAAEPSVNFAHLAALIRDGGDADSGGKVFGEVAVIGVAGKGDVEARGEVGSGAGQRLDQGRVLTGGEVFGNGLIVAEQAGVEGFELFDDGGDFEQIGERLLRRERHEVLNDALAGFPTGFAAGTVLKEEGFECAEPDFFEGLGRGPAAQEGEVHASPDVFMHQRKRLRVIAFEDGLEAVGQAGAGVDEFAAALTEPVELFDFLGHGSPGGECVAVVEDIERLVIGVGSVGASMGDDQRLAVGPGRRGIERIDRRGPTGGEEGEQVGRGLFEGDEQAGMRMLGLELGPPCVEVFGLKADGILVNGAGLGLEQGDRGGLVGTIERDNQLGDCVSHGI